MAKQTVLAQKGKRGPKPTGKGTQVVVRIQPDLLDALDRLIAKQPEPRPSRAEMLRRSLTRSLKRRGLMG